MIFLYLLKPPPLPSLQVFLNLIKIDIPFPCIFLHQSYQGDSLRPLLDLRSASFISYFWFLSLQLKITPSLSINFIVPLYQLMFAFQYHNLFLQSKSPCLKLGVAFSPSSLNCYHTLFIQIFTFWYCFYTFHAYFYLSSFDVHCSNLPPTQWPNNLISPLFKAKLSQTNLYLSLGPISASITPFK